MFFCVYIWPPKGFHYFKFVFTDGPLSLHESTIMMNSDTGQSPEKSRSQSEEDPSQNSTEQMNGQINYDELCNIKNLKVILLSIEKFCCDWVID